MISLTRLNGDRIAVNADLIERAEETPDTVITLTNGTKYVIAETLDELLHKIQVNRAGILALAGRMSEDELPQGEHRLRLVSPFPRPDPRTVVELDDDDDDGAAAPALAAGDDVAPGAPPAPATDATTTAGDGAEPADRSRGLGGRWHR